MPKRKRIPHPCIDCGADVTAEKAPRCRSCAAYERWRTRQPKRPYKTFNGLRYYENHEGYWQASRHKGHTWLHRDVWELTHGPIPEGWHVHHLDHDPGNNNIENLKAMPPDEHMRHHSLNRPKRSEETRQLDSLRSREWWARREPRTIICEECEREHVTTGTRVRFCSPLCNGRWWNRQVSLKKQEERKTRPKRWAWRHDACVNCATTSVKHFAKGLCTRCYYQVKVRPKKTEKPAV